MRSLILLFLVLASSAALAGTPSPPPPSAPESVPLLDAWGLVALSLGVALAGAIGVIRARKRK